MALDIDLNVDPYYDDYNEDKNFHQVLFRPSVPVQARELSQLQDILQNQIERFGDNIFSTGTIIRGCNFIFDSSYDYVKILDLKTDGDTTDVTDYLGLVAYDATSNLQAVVVDYQDGFESQNPDLKTLYIKYINSGSLSNTEVKTFAADATLSFYSNTATTNTGVAIANNYQSGLDVKVSYANTSPVGKGYAASVTEGIIYQKGYFIRVANNLTTIISKYSNTPNNIVVGFTTEENIITELSDPSLNDNAAGYTNYNAPGAHRLQLIPTLTIANADAVPANNFLSLVEWRNGNIVRLNQDTQYNKIGNEMARRTAESAGDYVVKKFRLSTEPAPANSYWFSTIVGAGLGYVSGFRIEQLNSLRVTTRRGIDTANLTGQNISTAYGNYVKAKEYAGYLTIGSSVDLYDTADQALTNRDYTTISATGNSIGTAIVLSVQYDSGTVDTPDATYRVYLTNIQMNAGKSFSSVKALASATGIADVVLDYNPTLAANVAMLRDPDMSTTVFPTGKNAVKTLYPSNTVTTSFVYRKNDTVTMNSNGVSSAVTLTGNTQFPYGVGTLTSTQEQSVIVVPLSTVNVTSTTGTVSSNTTNTQVVGSSTTFLTQYQVGDYIAITTDVRRITNIANNTYLTVDAAFSSTGAGQAHAKTYPKHIPINFSDRNSTIQTTNTTSMTITLKNSANTVEALSGSFSAAIYFDAEATTTAPTQKTVNQNVMVCIDTALSAAIVGTASTTTATNVIQTTNTTLADFISAGYQIYIANNSANGALLGTVSSVSGANITLTGLAGNTITSNAIVYSAPRAVGPSGPWPLGVPDAYRLRKVYKVSGNTFSNSSTNDVSSHFSLAPNQTDTYYGTSQLVKKPGSTLTINNGDKITAVFDVFTIPGGSGVGFFSVDSYPIDDANTANTSAIQTKYIPQYTTSTGQVMNLRDAIDFRRYTSNTVALTTDLTTAAAAYNPNNSTTFTTSGFVAPDSDFSYDVSYYLGRVDKLILNASGKYDIVEGMPSESPKPAADQINGMTMGIIGVPPYPSLLGTELDSATRYYQTVSVTDTQNVRYSMKDIGKLDKRITGLEYYTSLSLLETATQALTIKSDTTGLDRYKNGIFVDNFETTIAMNLADSEFTISRDPSDNTLQPVFNEFQIELQYDTDANAGNATIEKTGDLVTLAYTEVPVLTQSKATRVRNAAEGYYNWAGSLTTVPSYDSFIDVRNQAVTQVFNSYNYSTTVSETINNFQIDASTTNITTTTVTAPGGQEQVNVGETVTVTTGTTDTVTSQGTLQEPTIFRDSWMDPYGLNTGIIGSIWGVDPSDPNGWPTPIYWGS